MTKDKWKVGDKVWIYIGVPTDTNLRHQGTIVHIFKLGQSTQKFYVIEVPTPSLDPMLYVRDPTAMFHESETEGLD